MKPVRHQLRSPALVVGLWSVLLLSSCHRAPQNATELLGRLPQNWEGEITIQDEGASRKIHLQLRQLTMRDEHTLEFNRVRYQVFAGGQAVAEDEMAIRGTITAPGGEIRLDEDGTEVGAALKASAFKGQLSSDLQSAEASWTDGAGKPGTLKFHAAAP